MAHLLPNSDGLVVTEFDTTRTGVLIVNLDVTENIIITPQGGAGIRITLPPMTKLRIPDKIGLSIQGDNATRNFAVLDWKAGSAE